MTRFIDRVVLDVRAGDGGHGCASIRREKFKPLGGPDGGNGGRGGNVILTVDSQAHTLLDFHYRPHISATSGKPGMGDNRHGAAGADVVLAVPNGTVVFSSDGTMIADLVGEGASVTVAQGGRGGLGNAALASRARKAPGFALRGEKGDAADIVLELKSVADVGLIGYPSAGKSSLISVISAAKPKIADYPFTTLTPQLGVVTAGAETFTVADVPGLIPGASEGKGLGLEFLRHIERCAVLVHVVDCAAPEVLRNPVGDIADVEKELAQYAPLLATDLADKPRLIALNKIDIPAARDMAEFVADELREAGHQVFLISTATREGLTELIYAMSAAVDADRAHRPAPEKAPIVLRPHGVDTVPFTVEVDPQEQGGFLVKGRKVERWIEQTDFGNDEAVGYLADRLARIGVEDELWRIGAEPGAPVTIGEVTFDWEPATAAGGDTAMGGRGSDPRLDATERVSAAQRRAQSRQRRGLPEEFHGPDGAERGRKGRR